MQHHPIGPKARLDSLSQQIRSIQAKLNTAVSHDAMRTVGPVERLMLEIDLAELNIEYTYLLARHAMP